jgi:hypothetical protein
MKNIENSTVIICGNKRDGTSLTFRRTPQKVFKVNIVSIGPLETVQHLNQNSQIKTPDDLWREIQFYESNYDCGFHHQDIVNELAKLDWIIAAILAKKIGVEVPPVPDVELFTKQNSLRAIKCVEIAAPWNYEWHHIKISFEKWIRLIHGEVQFKSNRFGVDGKIHTAHWTLDINSDPQIYIPTCWEGSFTCASKFKGPIVDSYDLALLTLDSVEASQLSIENAKNETLTVTFIPKLRVN